MDRIFIRDLALRCLIGLYPEERKNKQEIIVNVMMETDLRAAGKSDALEDTVDYKPIKLAILDFVETSRFNLIESLANGIADICLNNKRVQSATVTIDKPGALRFARSVAVEITRHRPSHSVFRFRRIRQRIPSPKFPNIPSPISPDSPRATH